MHLVVDEPGAPEPHNETLQHKSQAKRNKRAAALPRLPPIPIAPQGSSSSLTLAVDKPFIVSLGRGRPRKPPTQDEAEPPDARFAHWMGHTFCRRALRDGFIVTYTGTVRDVQVKKQPKAVQAVPDLDVWVHVEWNDGDKEDMTLAELKDWEERDRAIQAIEQQARASAPSADSGMVVIAGSRDDDDDDADVAASAKPAANRTDGTPRKRRRSPQAPAMSRSRNDDDDDERVAAESDAESEVMPSARQRGPRAVAPRDLKAPPSSASAAPSRKRGRPRKVAAGGGGGGGDNDNDNDDGTASDASAPSSVSSSASIASSSSTASSSSSSASTANDNAAARAPVARRRGTVAAAATKRSRPARDHSDASSRGSGERAKPSARQPRTKRPPDDYSANRHAFRAKRSKKAAKAPQEPVPGALGTRGEFPNVLDLMRHGLLTPGPAVIQMSYGKHAAAVDLGTDGVLTWGGKRYADPLLMLNAFKEACNPGSERVYRDWRSLKYVGGADAREHRTLAAMREELKVTVGDEPLVAIAAGLQERAQLERLDVRNALAMAVSPARSRLVAAAAAAVADGGDHATPVCEACGEGGSVHVCASCGRATHARCAAPPLPFAPASPWLCGQCARPLDAPVRDLELCESPALDLAAVPQALSLALPPPARPAADFVSESPLDLGAVAAHAHWLALDRPPPTPSQLRFGVFRAPSASHPSCWPPEPFDADPTVWDVLPSNETRVDALAPGVSLLDPRDCQDVGGAELGLRRARAGWLAFAGGPITAVSFAPCNVMQAASADSHVALAAVACGPAVQLWLCSEAGGVRFACGIALRSAVRTCEFAPQSTTEAWVLCTTHDGDDAAAARVLLVPKREPLARWVDGAALQACVVPRAAVGAVRAQSWKPASLWLAAACTDARVRMWDVGALLVAGRTEAPAAQRVVAVDASDVCWGPGDLVATCDAGSGAVRVFDGEQEALAMRAAGVRCLAWPRGADYLVGGTVDGDVVVLQLVDGARLRVQAHTAAVTCVRVCERLEPPVLASAGADGLALVFRMQPAYAHDASGKRAASKLGQPGTLACGTAAVLRVASGRQSPPLLAVGSRLASLAASANAVADDWARGRRAEPPRLLELSACAFGYGGVDTLRAHGRNASVLPWPLALDFKADVLPGHHVVAPHGPVRHYEWIAAAGGASGVLRVCRVSVDADVN